MKHSNRHNPATIDRPEAAAAPATHSANPATADIHRRVTPAALIVAIGIVFGDIGTSPLYVMKAITGANPTYDRAYILGAVSCIFWTLTLQTTLKYVVIALHADNRGEGGILTLFSLLRHSRWRWLYIPAAIGAGTLIADGVITPAVTVTSAAEGLRDLYPGAPVVAIVLIIITLIFMLQRRGTGSIGRLFGPVMLLWFTMLGVLGLCSIHLAPGILAAFNPIYAVRLLSTSPEWFLILGAVFLCTTGAEALYSDLGHCGRFNITWAWAFVKVMLMLNYLGQGAWLLWLHSGAGLMKATTALPPANPFYGIMPSWFLPIGIIMSTLAAIIASQALLSGSFTLFSEAIGLDFWPRLKINYPSPLKGQLYIPLINTFLYAGCIVTVLLFRTSSAMEAAYGLAITITMLMTTLLLTFWMHRRRVPTWLCVIFASVFTLIEGVFLIANLSKFMHGGWYTLMIAAAVTAIMLLWRRANIVRNKHIDFVDFSESYPLLRDIAADREIPKYASNLVFFSKSPAADKVESKLIYSIVRKTPKRADRYWIVRVVADDAPDTLEYDYDILIPGLLVSIEMRIGYRVAPQVNVYLRQVINEMVEAGEVKLTSGYPSLAGRNIPGDFRFVLIHRVFSPSSNCSPSDRRAMTAYEWIDRMSVTPEKAMGLDTSSLTRETVPLIINTQSPRQIRRVIRR
ncbi:MAG: KUP/HAK/KT family potassium transporter [Muribaculaceae bacterium]|nr:KUP/HAK/KT family potassium transporter [Muribaculaceae bacterium]